MKPSVCFTLLMRVAGLVFGVVVGASGLLAGSHTSYARTLEMDSPKLYRLSTEASEASAAFETSSQGELEFCEYNIDLNFDDTFNIRDYVQPKTGNDPIDWSQVFFTYTDAGANDPTNPPDWHLSDFNAGLPVTVTAADAAPGTGNHGDGEYRIYIVRNGQSGFDDHATFRVDNDRESEVNAARCGPYSSGVADLELSQQVDFTNSGTTGGEPLIFIIDVFNNPNAGNGLPWPGAIDATSVEVNDLVTNNLVSYSSATFSTDFGGGTCAGCTFSIDDNGTPGDPSDDQAVFTLGTIPLGGTVTINLTTIIQIEGTAKSIGEVSTADQLDPDAVAQNCSLSDFVVAPVSDDECGDASVFVTPVELVSFDAILDGNSALIEWATASETNNAGFELQHRLGNNPAKDGAFDIVAFVEGAGTTSMPQHHSYRVEDLEPGRHVFRLKQIDFDGTFEYSAEVEVTAELPESYVVEPVYPNPFNPEATLRFGVKQVQEVRVEVFDVLGRRVLELYRGVPSVGVLQTVRIDGSSLSSGTYVVLVRGKTFTETQMATLIR